MVYSVASTLSVAVPMLNMAESLTSDDWPVASEESVYVTERM